MLCWNWISVTSSIFASIVDSTLCLADQKGLKQSDKAKVFLGLIHSDKLTKVLEK